MILNNIANKLAVGAAILCLSVGAVGCSDFMDVEPTHEAGEDQQWKTLEDTRSALFGIYGLTRSALVDNNTIWAVGDLRSGDFSVTSRRDLQAIADNNLNNSEKLIDEIGDWRRFYAAINAASVFIERAPGIIGQDMAYSEENLKYDLAQARTLRALCYFYIARIWGDAPLIIYSYDNGSFPMVGKSNRQELLDYAKKELTEVADILPFEYGTKNSLYYRQNAEYWRGKLINKAGAYALLAQVCAEQSQYSETETYTSYILDNLKSLKSEWTTLDYDNLVSSQGYFCGSATTYAHYRFLSFDFIHGNNETTQAGHIEDWTLAAPYAPKQYPEIYVSKATLSEMFDGTNDKRFLIDPETGKYSATSYVDMNCRFPIFKKINVLQDGNSSDNDYAVFGSSVSLSREEDVKLLKAEALCVLNRSSEAISLLNQIRVSRGLGELSYKNDFGSNNKQLLAEIFNERRREFLGEGMRWFDMIRRQKLLHDNDMMQNLIDNGGIYWPISTKVLRNNSMIVQNSYWSR